jgi:hypothetical protein
VSVPLTSEKNPIEKTKTIIEIPESEEQFMSNDNINSKSNIMKMDNLPSLNNVNSNDNFLQVKNSSNLEIRLAKEQFQEANEYMDGEHEMEEKCNYLSQIFEGARVTFDVNKENIETKVKKIIKMKEIENLNTAKKKYKHWAKVKGLLNFFLIMRSELFKRKIQGLAHKSKHPDETPLE